MISLPLWRERLDRLNSQLNAEPDAPRGWRWRSEAKVLRFLLRRYGEGRPLSPLGNGGALWISWLALDAPEKTRLSPRALVSKLWHIARLNREVPLDRDKSGSFWAAFFHSTGDAQLEGQKRQFEIVAKESERKRNLAEKKYQRRQSSRK